MSNQAPFGGSGRPHLVPQDECICLCGHHIDIHAGDEYAEHCLVGLCGCQEFITRMDQARWGRTSAFIEAEDYDICILGKDAPF